MATNIIYTSSVAASSLKATALQKLIVIGEASLLSSSEFSGAGLSLLVSELHAKETTSRLSSVKTLLKAVDKDSIHHILGKGENVLRISIAAISNKRTRSNAVIRADLIPALVSKLVSDEENAHVSFVVNEDQAFAAGCAVARAFPQYSRKSSFLSKKERTIEVSFISASGKPFDVVKVDEIQYTADSIRLTARLTDTPCSELHTDAYIEEIRREVGALPQPSQVTTRIIKGHDLEKCGFGGLWGVGKAAVHLPALVILSYTPPRYTDVSKNIAMVGKGICFDTGGLSLKSTTGMPTMKVDMGGSAAILGAFLASIRMQVPHKLHAVLCLAENSVDQLSTRPDDILTMYSGKTVEVNNTDAEGRLVLGDGVAYASQDLASISHIIDMATLTGAQLIATGPRHAGFMTNQAEFESQVIQAAHFSGDLAYPLMYSPEFLMKDLESDVADMKNSNKNGPTTAASSLAGHFIEAHLHSDYTGVWCHIDIAGPATKGPRATGYGVALLMHIIKNIH